MKAKRDLIDAVFRGDTSEIKRLLDGSKSDINQTDDDKRTPLMHAAIDGKDDIVELLIKHQADANLHDTNGYTALHFAAQNYKITSASLLIDAGAEVDAVDNFGNTPLARAVFNSKGRGEVIQLLLARGAHPNKTNSSGVSPIKLANNIGNYDVASFFTAPPPPKRGLRH